MDLQGYILGDRNWFTKQKELERENTECMYSVDVLDVVERPELVIASDDVVERPELVMASAEVVERPELVMASADEAEENRDVVRVLETSDVVGVEEACDLGPIDETIDEGKVEETSDVEPVEETVEVGPVEKTRDVKPVEESGDVGPLEETMNPCIEQVDETSGKDFVEEPINVEQVEKVRSFVSRGIKEIRQFRKLLLHDIAVLHERGVFYSDKGKLKERTREHIKWEEELRDTLVNEMNEMISPIVRNSSRTEEGWRCIRSCRRIKGEVLDFLDEIGTVELDVRYTDDGGTQLEPEGIVFKVKEKQKKKKKQAKW